jgi:5-methylcytosine-specific restriction endonuclease McrA
MPQSRGGGNTWLNTVAACLRCNNRKANRTPAEASMLLSVRPIVPSWRDAMPSRR